LQPDLILLDIGLPTLNGMEAARRIGRLVPHAKILFFSQESSPDVVREARRVGAMGYVHKERAQSDLLPALEAFRASKQFVSSGLKGWESAESKSDRLPRHHEVQFYSEDEVFFESFAGFIRAALKISDVTIVLATKPHLEGLFQRLKAESVDVDGATQRGTYIPIDAVESLSEIMVDGLPDALLFFESIDGLIEEASKKAKVEHPRVAFCGERVGLLWAEGKTEAAIRLEQLCDDLATKYNVDVLCAYPLGSFSDEQNEADFKRICAKHSAVHSR
jgi:CheY-like chemotaxis protein